MVHEPSPDKRRQFTRLSGWVIRQKLAPDLEAFEARARRTLPGDEWQLEAERQELLDKLDKVERRIRLEMEARTRPDGMVPWAEALMAVLKWDPGEVGEGE